MIRTLREERGREKMEANNAAHKRADVAKASRNRAARSASPSLASASAGASGVEEQVAGGPGGGGGGGGAGTALAAAALSTAEQHRDRLLGYQATSARRTRIIDEAADFETPTAGLSPWASPQERALQLKRQQRVLREQAWQARPEYEKRTMVVAIDLAGRKVVKEMRRVERPADEEDGDEGPEEVEEEEEEGPGAGAEGHGGYGLSSSSASVGQRNGGAFSRNPLLGGLVRPRYPTSKAEEGGRASEGEASQRRDGVGGEGRADDRRAPLGKWRRVQDDFGDNERVILDGGFGADDPIVA